MAVKDAEGCKLSIHLSLEFFYSFRVFLFLLVKCLVFSFYLMVASMRSKSLPMSAPAKGLVLLLTSTRIGKRLSHN